MANLKTIQRGVALMRSELKNGEPFTADRYANWVRMTEVAGLDDEAFLEASSRAAMTLTFFPTFGELLKTVRANQDDEIERAWHSALAVVRRYGTAATIFASDVYGGGRTLWALQKCGWNEANLGSMVAERRAIHRAEFVRIWKACPPDMEYPARLAGDLERENAGRIKVLEGGYIGRPDRDDKMIAAGETPAALPAGEQTE